MASQQNMAVRAGSGRLIVVDPADSGREALCLARLDANLTAGTVDFSITAGTENTTAADDRGVVMQDPALMFVVPPGSTYTAAHAAAANEMRWTPVADADLAGDLTLYTPCEVFTSAALHDATTATGAAFAKLKVPATAGRQKAPRFLLGQDRMISADSAVVQSLADGQGAAVPNAFGRLNGGAFSVVAQVGGVNGYLSLTEALTNWFCVNSGPLQFGALGL